MKGYKVFNTDWTCRDFQYEVGKTYEEQGKPECYKKGFHFCMKLSDCFNYYRFDPNNKVAEVEALGDIDEGNNKCCTNKIKIVREISWYEVLEMANTGKGCTGFGNSGDYNSGDCNSGKRNSGCGNSGDENSGCYNSGRHNSGNYNSEDYNSGDCNSGWRNSGYKNSGNYNSGDYNSGDYNSGYKNSGCRNSGWHNSGDYNSGRHNSGDCNSGDFNSGNFNSGRFNSCNYSSGFFCTKEPKAIVFNIETDMTVKEFLKSKYMKAIKSGNFKLTEWIKYSEEEMEKDKDKRAVGGYLKKYTYKKACKNWWNNMSEKNKKIIQSIPNFDKDIFKEITGIDVDQK